MPSSAERLAATKPRADQAGFPNRRGQRLSAEGASQRANREASLGNNSKGDGHVRIPASRVTSGSEGLPTTRCDSQGEKEGDAARSMELKLTLKERLDNYDRQRGMNIGSLNQGKDGSGTSVPLYSRESHAPCLGMTALPLSKKTGKDAVTTRTSVTDIVARSLGRAVAAIRQRPAVGGKAYARKASPKKNADLLQDLNVTKGRQRYRIPPLRSAPAPAKTPSTDTGPSAKSAETLRDSSLRNAEVSLTTGSRKDTIPAPSEASDSRTCDAATAPPSSSSSSASRVPPIVPRVANLAFEKQKIREETERRRRTWVVRTKEFDPDKLECVLRHEASVAERAQQIEAVRKATRERSTFKARPLPAFLSTIAPCRSGDGERCNRRVKVDGEGGDPDRESLATPGKDPEACTLLERVRRADSSSDAGPMLRLTAFPLPATERRSSSEHPATGSNTLTTTSQAHPTDGSSTFASSGEASREVDRILEGQDYGGSGGGEKSQVRVTGRVRGRADPGDDAARDSDDGANHRTGASTSGIGEEDAGATSLGGVNARSLMGRMLGSGTSMLERQREWVKARNRKVLESRRKAEEDKAREGQEDAIEDGFGERSWILAKTQHLRSLERQKAEDKLREELREARRKASLLRAERDREAVERETAILAAALGSASARQRKSEFFDKTEASGRTKRAVPLRRTKNPTGGVAQTEGAAGAHGAADDKGVDDACATSDEMGARPTGPGSDVPAANDVERMSPEEFYRVAVEKIVGGDKDPTRSGRRSRQLKGKDELGVKVDGGERRCDPASDPKKGGRRRCRMHQDRHSTRAIPLPPCPVYVSSLKRAKCGYRQQPDGRSSLRGRGRQRRSCNRWSEAAVGSHGRHLPNPPRNSTRGALGARLVGRGIGNDLAIDRTVFDADCAASLGSPRSFGGENPRAIGRSLLSLYEAQSVEHYNGRPSSCDDPTVAARHAEDVNRGGISSSGNSYYRREDNGERTDTVAAAQAVLVPDTVPLGEESGPLNWSSGSQGHQRSLEGGDEGGALPGQQWYLSAREKETEETHFSPDGDYIDDSCEREVAPGWGSIRDARRARFNRAICVGEDRQVSPDGGQLLSGIALDMQPTVTASEDSRIHPSGDLTTVPKATEAEHTYVNGALPRAHGTWADGNAVDSLSGLDALQSCSSLAHVRSGHIPSKPSPPRSPSFNGELELRDGNRRGDGAWRIALAGREVDPVDRDEEQDLEGGEPRPYGLRMTKLPAECPDFFDAATSSADKGRLRVQDPRLFDPCSMRRVPCAALAGSTIGGGKTVAHAATDRARVSVLDAEGALDGVTLLVGRKACDRTGEPSGEEELITVMFDRTKFNEDEARWWWGVNGPRVSNGFGFLVE